MQIAHAGVDSLFVAKHLVILANDENQSIDLFSFSVIISVTHIDSNLVVAITDIGTLQYSASFAREDISLLCPRAGDVQRRPVVLISALDRASTERGNVEFTGGVHPFDAVAVAEEYFVLLDLEGGARSE